MAQRRHGLTTEQHLSLGSELQRIREELMTISMIVSTGYPVTSKATREADKALKAIDNLRYELDSRSSEEMPHGDWETVIYGGQNQERREQWLAQTHPDVQQLTLQEIRAQQDESARARLMGA